MPKVKYGLSNVYYAIFNEDDGTYSTPVAIPGAVSLSLDPEGETTPFRADNIDYWTSVSNNGYSGSLEVALVPDSFLTDVMGEVKDATSGIQYEKADAKPKAFALLFQFENDVNATRYVFYNVKATRPSVSSETTPTGGIEPQTESMDITASARPQDNITKGRCVTGDPAYADFYKSVVVPQVA